MGMFKAKKTTKTKSKSSLGSKLKGVASKLTGKRTTGGGKRRRRGPEYWAKKVLVEKLKKRYWKAKYGGR